MIQTFNNLSNYQDRGGNPTGGIVEATGLVIHWQDGPLGRGEDRQEPNGAFVETVISAVAHRIAFYQDSKFHCIENAIALGHLNAALNVLNERTRARDDRDVEGTHTK